MLAKPLDVDVYFDPASLDSDTEDLAYTPQKIFQRQFVVFGERAWERTAPNRFELVGSKGTISVQFTADFRKVEFRRGNNRLPLHFEGTPAQRQAKAGFISVLGMSGLQPTLQVHEAAAAAGPWVIGGILAVMAAAALLCEALRFGCKESASAACSPASANVHAGPCTISGGPVGASVSFNCSWTCNNGGGGGGGSGVPTTAGGSASAGGGGNDDGNDDGNDSNGEHDGEDNGESGNGGAGDCNELEGFHIGSLPGAGGGIIDYASADGTGSGGGGGGGDAGDSTGC